MADFRGISATCTAVIYLLRSNFDPADFGGQELEFSVYNARDFAEPMEAGVSLFVHRAYVNGSHRAPAGSIGPNGQKRRNKLPLDIHFLLIAWGRDASQQQAIAGWMMRVLEDVPILPAGLLNAVMANVFDASESIEISISEMSNEDLFHLWEVLSPNNYHLSIPYMARNLNIESTKTLTEGPAVQERNLDYHQIES